MKIKIGSIIIILNLLTVNSGMSAEETFPKGDEEKHNAKEESPSPKIEIAPILMSCPEPSKDMPLGWKQSGSGWGKDVTFTHAVWAPPAMFCAYSGANTFDLNLFQNMRVFT